MITKDEFLSKLAEMLEGYSWESPTGKLCVSLEGLLSQVSILWDQEISLPVDYCDK